MILGLLLAAGLAADPTAALTGVVKDTSGGVVSAADVRVSCAAATARLTTDSNGRFEAPGLPADRCLIVVEGEGFAPASAHADLRRSGSRAITIVLQIRRFASDIVVTPTRGLEETSFMVPQGTSVVDRRALESRPYALLPQVLREEPGVLAQSTTSAQGSPVVRGFTGQRNVYLLDGVRLNTAAWRDGPSQYFAWVAPSFVDRLEIVRGPGSVQYGSDALGATLNILTSGLAFSDGGTLVNGSMTGTAASAMRSGAFDGAVSLSTPRAAFRAAGWYTSLGDSRPGGGRDSHAAVTRFLGLPDDTLGSRLRGTGFEQTSGLVAARTRISSDTVLQASYVHDVQSGATRYDRTFGGAGIYRSEFAPQTLDFARVGIDRQRAGLFDEVAATVSVNRQSDGRLEQSRPGARIDQQVTDTTAVGYQAHAGKAIANHLLSFGAELYDEYIGGSRTLIEPTGEARADRPDIPDGTRYVSTGVFAQTVSALVPQRLTVRAGLRYGHFAFATRSDPALGVVEEHVRTGAFTFNTGVVVGLTPHVNAVGSVSRGFRAANAFDLGGVGLSGGGGFEVSPSRARTLGALRGTTDGASAMSSGALVSGLGPETVMAYEAGVKVQTSRVAATLTGFDLELRDAIDRRALIFDHDVVGSVVAGFAIARQDSGGRAYIAADARPIVTRVNVSRSRIVGFEGQAIVSLSRELEARTHLSMANGRDLNSGAYLRRMPPIMGGATLRWQRGRAWAEAASLFARSQTRLSDGDVGDARIGASRTPASIAGYFNGTAVDLGLVANGTVVATGETLAGVQQRLLGGASAAPMFSSTPGFVVLGLRVGVPLGERVDLSVITENLLDRNYRFHGSGVDEPGFNVQLRTRLRF